MNNQKLVKGHGLFGKLLFIFMTLSLILTVIFGFSFHYFGDRPFRKIINKNLENYARYLVNEIGTPPDLEKAHELSRKTSTAIYIRSKDINYSSKRKPLDFSRIRKIRRISSGDMSFYRMGRKRFIAIEKNNIQYIFTIDRKVVRSFPWIPLIFACLLSLFCIILAYRLISNLFTPLEHIKKAAEHYAKGDLSHTFPIRGSDQLAVLSLSIQEMAFKIREMLDSKRELLLAIAHELRTPITRAKLHLEMVENSKGKEDLNIELNEMTNIINDLLESERLREGYQVLNLESIALQDIINDLLSITFKNENSITFKSGKNLKIDCDPTKYKLLIKNLISNGLVHGLDRKVEIDLQETSLRVMSYGNLLTDEQIQKVVEPFYRVDKARDRKSGGIGLGLYLVYQIAKAHKHELAVKVDKDLNANIFLIKFNSEK